MHCDCWHNVKGRLYSKWIEVKFEFHHFDIHIAIHKRVLSQTTVLN